MTATQSPAMAPAGVDAVKKPSQISHGTVFPVRNILSPGFALPQQSNRKKTAYGCHVCK
jgi:hypothetical protein